MAVPDNGCWWDGGQTSQTLDAVLHKGQTMPEKNRFPAVLQPTPINTQMALRGAETSNSSREGIGVGDHGDPAFTLQAAHHHAVCTTGNITHTLKAEGFDGGDAIEELSPTIRAGWHANSHANAGVMPAIAFPANLSGTQCASTEEVAPAMGAKNPTAITYSIQAGALRTNPDSGPDGVGVQADHAYTLESRAEVQAVAVSLRGRDGGGTAELGDYVQNCLRASNGGGDKPHVLNAMRVRRLTPRECERLQGMPDDHTMVPYRGKPAADGPRYKAIGNSMAVPVMAWIGRRIQQVSELIQEAAA